METLQLDRKTGFGSYSFICSLAFLLYAGQPAAAAERTERLPPDQIGDHGYALLFALLGDEKDVSKLRIIKHEAEELKNLTKEISRVCGEAHKKIEAFGKADACSKKLNRKRNSFWKQITPSASRSTMLL